MTKADLITVIADKLKFPWARAGLLVDVVFDCMEQSMSRGEKIEIRGFGSFTVRQYCAYNGRNPRSGQVVAVRPKRLPHFKVSTEVATRINYRRGKEVEATVPPGQLLNLRTGTQDTTSLRVQDAWLSGRMCSRIAGSRY
jgi:integration host factor subunit beta